MKNKKRRFMVVGEIEANGNKFKEHIWAYSEAQAVTIIKDRLKKRHSNIKVFLVNVETRDITHFNKKEVGIYGKILSTKTK